jgi:hypothetical protein
MNQLQYFNEERETNIFMLDSFPSDIDNVLDRPVNQLIKSIKDKLKKCDSKYIKLQKKDREEETKYKNLNKARSYDNEIQIEIFTLLEDISYLEEELNALFEIKVIYAFKHLEINLKLLLSMAYPTEFNSKTYKWETIIQFLNSKKIDITTIKEYNDINQLRIVNNSLKHSGRMIEQSIKNIKEFKGKEFYYYIDLEAFYLRVDSFPKKFLISLKNKIIKELYNFSKVRIKELANSFHLRMTKEQALLLSKELLKPY